MTDIMHHQPTPHGWAATMVAAGGATHSATATLAAQSAR